MIRDKAGVGIKNDLHSLSGIYVILCDLNTSYIYMQVPSLLLSTIIYGNQATQHSEEPYKKLMTIQIQQL